MRYEEMNQQTKDVFNAVLAKSLEYPIEKKMAAIETTDNEITVRSQNTMNQFVVEAVVRSVAAFDLGFWVDCERKDIIIRIY